MSQLQDNLDEILRQKNVYLLPGNIKKDITLLGITGTYEGSGGPTEGIKQFSSIEEMNASTGNVDGDLAVVYGDSLSNWTLDTEYNKLTFPNNVVLSEAVSGHIMSMIEAVDIEAYMFIGDANVTPDGFQFNAWMPSGESITVQYESSDGLTYTKTSGPDTIELEQNVHANDYDWNDVIGNFIKYGNKFFNGLFQYNTDHFDVAQSQLNLSNSNELLPGVIGYGSGGTVTGTTAVYNNLNESDVYQHIYNLNQLYKDTENKIFGTDIDHQSLSSVNNGYKMVPVKKLAAKNENENSLVIRKAPMNWKEFSTKCPSAYIERLYFSRFGL
ncbi:MAG: hypothetical protein II393_02460 [Cytophagales bacterium]|nr:hypothetical protein [Cytophagales bacterium]